MQERPISVEKQKPNRDSFMSEIISFEKNEGKVQQKDWLIDNATKKYDPVAAGRTKKSGRGTRTRIHPSSSEEHISTNSKRSSQ